MKESAGKCRKELKRQGKCRKVQANAGKCRKVHKRAGKCREEQNSEGKISKWWNEEGNWRVNQKREDKGGGGDIVCPFFCFSIYPQVTSGPQKRTGSADCVTIYTINLSLCTQSIDPNPFRGTTCSMQVSFLLESVFNFFH